MTIKLGLGVFPVSSLSSLCNLSFGYPSISLSLAVHPCNYPHPPYLPTNQPTHSPAWGLDPMPPGLEVGVLTTGLPTVDFSLEGQKLSKTPTTSEVILLFLELENYGRFLLERIRQSRLSRSVHPRPWSVLEKVLQKRRRCHHVTGEYVERVGTPDAVSAFSRTAGLEICPTR